ncbi:hypothetical protein FH972_017211 [Carpinus fangiana]|uniref:Uncharacterized protein n=1 Tax=Carpinus fangiana TaxID=176857 RepID=A0A5N6RJJ5_9ROSI|nr:hypothetical protein FH972_017211 [Carpinus fangiana]
MISATAISNAVCPYPSENLSVQKCLPSTSVEVERRSFVEAAEHMHVGTQQNSGRGCSAARDVDPDWDGTVDWGYPCGLVLE